MEITDSFLVAMMFVMILSIGIASILQGLGNIIKEHYQNLHWLPITWIILILLSHLDLFWHTVLIVAIEDWQFVGFLYMVCGPVLLFLAVNVLATESVEGKSVGSLKHYFEVSPYLFTLLALLMLWGFAADYVLKKLSIFSTQYILEFAIFLALALRKNVNLHQLATIFICALVLITLVAREFGWSVS